MNILARQGNASVEPELLEAMQEERRPEEDVHVCVGICPHGHDCTLGCEDPRTCAKW